MTFQFIRKEFIQLQPEATHGPAADNHHHRSAIGRDA
jgi:hypothetical protein